jgi:hypothetical protein
VIIPSPVSTCTDNDNCFPTDLLSITQQTNDQQGAENDTNLVIVKLLQSGISHHFADHLDPSHQQRMHPRALDHVSQLMGRPPNI